MCKIIKKFFNKILGGKKMTDNKTYGIQSNLCLEEVLSKKNIVSLEGEFTDVKSGTTMDYPNGFNFENTIVLSLMWRPKNYHFKTWFVSDEFFAELFSNDTQNKIGIMQNASTSGSYTDGIEYKLTIARLD